MDIFLLFYLYYCYFKECLLVKIDINYGNNNFMDTKVRNNNNSNISS